MNDPLTNTADTVRTDVSPSTTNQILTETDLAIPGDQVTTEVGAEKGNTDTTLAEAVSLPPEGNPLPPEVAERPPCEKCGQLVSNLYTISQSARFHIEWLTKTRIGAGQRRGLDGKTMTLQSGVMMTRDRGRLKGPTRHHDSGTVPSSSGGVVATSDRHCRSCDAYFMSPPTFEEHLLQHVRDGRPVVSLERLPLLVHKCNKCSAFRVDLLEGKGGGGATTTTTTDLIIDHVKVKKITGPRSILKRKVVAHDENVEGPDKKIHLDLTCGQMDVTTKLKMVDTVKAKVVDAVEAKGVDAVEAKVVDAVEAKVVDTIDAKVVDTVKPKVVDTFKPENADIAKLELPINADMKPELPATTTTTINSEHVISTSNTLIGKEVAVQQDVVPPKPGIVTPKTKATRKRKSTKQQAISKHVVITSPKVPGKVVPKLKLTPSKSPDKATSKVKLSGKIVSSEKPILTKSSKMKTTPRKTPEKVVSKLKVTPVKAHKAKLKLTDTKKTDKVVPKLRITTKPIVTTKMVVDSSATTVTSVATIASVVTLPEILPKRTRGTRGRGRSKSAGAKRGTANNVALRRCRTPSPEMDSDISDETSSDDSWSPTSPTTRDTLVWKSKSLVIGRSTTGRIGKAAWASAPGQAKRTLTLGPPPAVKSKLPATINSTTGKPCTSILSAATKSTAGATKKAGGMPTPSKLKSSSAATLLQSAKAAVGLTVTSVSNAARPSPSKLLISTVATATKNKASTAQLVQAQRLVELSSDSDDPLLNTPVVPIQPPIIRSAPSTSAANKLVITKSNAPIALFTKTPPVITTGNSATPIPASGQPPITSPVGGSNGVSPTPIRYTYGPSFEVVDVTIDGGRSGSVAGRRPRGARGARVARSPVIKKVQPGVSLTDSTLTTLTEPSYTYATTFNIPTNPLKSANRPTAAGLTGHSTVTGFHGPPPTSSAVFPPVSNRTEPVAVSSTLPTWSDRVPVTTSMPSPGFVGSPAPMKPVLGDSPTAFQHQGVPSTTTTTSAMFPPPSGFQNSSPSLASYTTPSNLASWDGSGVSLQTISSSSSSSSSSSPSLNYQRQYASADSSTLCSPATSLAYDNNQQQAHNFSQNRYDVAATQQNVGISSQANNITTHQQQHHSSENPYDTMPQNRQQHPSRNNFPMSATLPQYLHRPNKVADQQQAVISSYQHHVTSSPPMNIQSQVTAATTTTTSGATYAPPQPTQHSQSKGPLSSSSQLVSQPPTSHENLSNYSSRPLEPQQQHYQLQHNLQAPQQRLQLAQPLQSSRPQQRSQQSSQVNSNNILSGLADDLGPFVPSYQVHPGWGGAGGSQAASTYQPVAHGQLSAPEVWTRGQMNLSLIQQQQQASTMPTNPPPAHQGSLGQSLAMSSRLTDTLSSTPPTTTATTTGYGYIQQQQQRPMANTYPSTKSTSNSPSQSSYPRVGGGGVGEATTQANESDRRYVPTNQERWASQQQAQTLTTLNHSQVPSPLPLAYSSARPTVSPHLGTATYSGGGNSGEYQPRLVCPAIDEIAVTPLSMSPQTQQHAPSINYSSSEVLTSSAVVRPEAVHRHQQAAPKPTTRPAPQPYQYHNVRGGSESTSRPSSRPPSQPATTTTNPTFQPSDSCSPSSSQQQQQQQQPGMVTGTLPADSPSFKHMYVFKHIQNKLKNLIDYNDPLLAGFPVPPAHQLMAPTAVLHPAPAHYQTFPAASGWNAAAAANPYPAMSLYAGAAPMMAYQQPQQQLHHHHHHHHHPPQQQLLLSGITRASPSTTSTSQPIQASAKAPTAKEKPTYIPETSGPFYGSSRTTDGLAMVSSGYASGGRSGVGVSTQSGAAPTSVSAATLSHHRGLVSNELRPSVIASTVTSSSLPSSVMRAHPFVEQPEQMYFHLDGNNAAGMPNGSAAAAAVYAHQLAPGGYDAAAVAAAAAANFYAGFNSNVVGAAHRHHPMMMLAPPPSSKPGGSRGGLDGGYPPGNPPNSTYTEL